MDMLIFEDDEIELLIQALNKIQMIFHPDYAANGKFEYSSIINLQSKDVKIFVDNNILSPIYDLITNGTLKNEFQLQKISLFILFSKYIRAQITCGLALFENDTAEKSHIAAENKRQAFLFGIDEIPLMVWKKLAFGELNSIPKVFLSKFQIDADENNYKNPDELHYLMHKVAIMKIVHLLRDKTLKGFEKYITFFVWYADNLIISESMLVYAALLFGNVEHVDAPKKYNSNIYENVLSGIDNQAWDMFYLTHWSSYYYEEENDIYMFATDDITQKFIIVNNQKGGYANLAGTVFSNKKQKETLVNLFNSKLGENRINPLANKNKQEKIEHIKCLQNKVEDEFVTMYFKDKEV